jgi:Ser/Thr protein kinase RdoA (MazF antagonist)
MIAYSTLQIAFLTSLLQEQYGMPHEKVSVMFLKRGFNDTYKVTAGKDKFILRVYRFKRRSLQEIQSELDVLLFLHKNGIPISIPLPDKYNRLIQKIETPEGARAAVLFSYVSGESLRKPSVLQCRQAGEALGAIHKTLTAFDGGPLSWEYQPTKIFTYVRQAVNDTLHNFPDDLVYLDRLEELIDKRLSGVILKQGICHGDLQPENFLFLENGPVSFIDFDFSGHGPLLYDLGAYTWYDHQGKTKEMLQSFFTGYSGIVPLTDEEKDLIPLFGSLRALFLMGMWTRFMDGESNPVWPAEQVSSFVKKLKKWTDRECRL